MEKDEDDEEIYSNGIKRIYFKWYGFNLIFFVRYVSRAASGCVRERVGPVHRLAPHSLGKWIRNIEPIDSMHISIFRSKSFLFSFAETRAVRFDTDEFTRSCCFPALVSPTPIHLRSPECLRVYCACMRRTLCLLSMCLRCPYCLPIAVPPTPRRHSDRFPHFFSLTSMFYHLFFLPPFLLLCQCS